MAGRRARGAQPPLPRSQHFLRTNALARELVRDAGVGPDEVVVDIGAGHGRLTAELARAARRVVAVELDPACVSRLRGRWPNVDVVAGDAVQMTLPHEPFRVVANLPFHRTNDLLRLLLDDPRIPLTRADLIVEWGVAVKRALPWPSSVNSVLWGAFYEVSVARRLPPSAFAPPPRVHAGVLVCRRRERPLIEPEAAAAYRSFVADGFRRGPRSVASVSHGTVARDLDPRQWAELFRARPPRASARRPAAV